MWFHYLFFDVRSPFLRAAVGLEVLKERWAGVGGRQMGQEVGHSQLVVVDLNHCPGQWDQVGIGLPLTRWKKRGGMLD